MSHGVVCPESNCAHPVDVKRGMTIRSKEGLEMGKVAAVVLSRDRHTATHILLCRLPEMSGYWLVSVDLIEEVCDESVQLSIPMQGVDALPCWKSA